MFISIVVYDPQTRPQLQTDPPYPNKGWFSLLRLYSPTEAWFDKTWRPGEIELVK